MSLRNRLTLLYIAVTGGILLLLGMFVYLLVSTTLVRQVDESLAHTFYDILRESQVNSVGNMDVIRLPPLDMTSNVYVQAWRMDGTLTAASVNISQFSSPLDTIGLGTASPLFHDVTVENAHIRVLSVPVMLGDRQIGVLQIASTLNLVDDALRILLSVLALGIVLAMALAGGSVWLTTRRALAPLESVTKTALQITRAADLSSRIPYHGPQQDEIGQLILAFNQTLERLEQLFLLQRRFVDDVGHELRTPLTVIKGNVDLMRRMAALDADALESIEGETDRLTRLVGDLLVLARAEAGKLPLNLHPVEFDTLVLDVLNQAQVLAQGKVHLHLTEIDQVLVCGDQDRLKQVLWNILGNAIKYTPAGGEVEVCLSKQKKMAFVTIRDSGPGIPKEDLPHIFERFYRAEKSRVRSGGGQGFGLGLSIAYWIVQSHGGNIEVSSTVGEGTEFRIWLPLTDN